MIDWLKRSAIAPEIELNGEIIPIVVTRRKAAKRLTLRLAPDGREVRISLPVWAHGNEAIAFAHARAEWLAQIHASIPRRPAPDAGEEVLYRARPLTIAWQPGAPRRPQVSG
ncbi:MAG: metal-dependent hydrolase, partial [Erythrobacter sp.]|nr:metal-dependent hydrolase [Erythrobacter sp.]